MKRNKGNVAWKSLLEVQTPLCTDEASVPTKLFVFHKRFSPLASRDRCAGNTVWSLHGLKAAVPLSSWQNLDFKQDTFTLHN